MAEEDIRAVSNERPAGRVIMGGLLVAAGAALLVDQLGAMPPTWRTSIWPVLLIAYGLARLAQPRANGREGLFFALAGSWWLAATSGWISLQVTWPLLFVALGVSIMFQSITAGADAGSQHLGRQRGTGWILVLILLGAAVTSGLGRRAQGEDTSGPGALRVYSVLGGSNNRMRATALTGGEVVSIMGGSGIDLRDVTIAPGESATLDILMVMGGGSIRVPDNWTVDVKTVSVMGGIKDQRVPRDRQQDSAGGPEAAAAAGAPPRLILRGTIIMGGLTIRS